jgi:hypothetical protein
MEEFRPAPIAALIARGQQLPVDDPIVRAHPQFFRGLVRLDERSRSDAQALLWLRPRLPAPGAEAQPLPCLHQGVRAGS